MIKKPLYFYPTFYRQLTVRTAANPPPALCTTYQHPCTMNVTGIKPFHTSVLAWHFWKGSTNGDATNHPNPRLSCCQFRTTCLLPKFILTRMTVKTKTNLSVFTLLALCVGYLQVAVCGSQFLPAHDLLLQLHQRDVRAVKNQRVVAEFGGEFVMNMSHFDTDRRGEKIRREIRS